MVTAAFVVFNRLLDLHRPVASRVGRFEFEAALSSAARSRSSPAPCRDRVGLRGHRRDPRALPQEFVCCHRGSSRSAPTWGAPGGRTRSLARAAAHRHPPLRGRDGPGAGHADPARRARQHRLRGGGGPFSAAQRFGDAAYVLAITGGFALLPGIAYLAKAEPDRARRLVRRVLVPVVAGSVAVSLVAIPLAEPIMRLVFGGHFAVARRPLPDHRGGPARLCGPRAVLVRGRGVRWRGAAARGGAHLLPVVRRGVAAARPGDGRRRRGLGLPHHACVTAALSYVALERQLRTVRARGRLGMLGSRIADDPYGFER